MGRKTEKQQSSLSDEKVEQKEVKSPHHKEEENKFEPITEIEFKFLLQDVETRTEGLSKFISTSEAFNDGVPCSDVVKKYLRSSPACEELLALLQPLETALKTPGIALVLKCLEQILTRIRSDLTKNLITGEAIVQKVLAGHMKHIYASLQAQSKSNIIKSAVQFLLSVALLSEKTKRALQARLNFTHVHFAALFRRRNRKDPQDVRSCMTLLTLAFLVNSDSNSVRFMVQQKTFLHLTISGLKFDAKEVVVDVLLTLLDKVVKNSSVSKTDKVKLFSEVVLRQIAELHQWQGPQAWSPSGDAKHKQGPDLSPEAAEDLAQVADVADSVLQELCCSSKHGISFYDKTVGTGSRPQNQLLSHFLSWLTKHIEEKRKAVLVVNILAANPDLICGVLIELQTSLEPRWSDSWAHRLDWLGSLYSALPDIPPFLSDKESKISNDQKIVTMATVFCLPPPKVTSILNQSLKHEDIQVRHRHLELVQVLIKKAYTIQKALVSWSAGMGYSAEDVEYLKDIFTTTVLKSLPAVSQLFGCVDKIMAFTSLADLAGKDAVAVMETKLCVGLGEHTCLLLRVLSLYQNLMPSLLAQRPKDISKLLKVVVSQRDVDPGSQKKLDGHGTVDTDKDGQPGSDRNKADQVEQLGAASTEEEENQLPQLYLLKLLSETDARTLALTREGLLEKLLQLAEHGRYMDLTVRLICKMLQSMEIFSRHGQELAIWLRNALDIGNLFSDKDGDNDEAEKQRPASAKVKSAKKLKGRELSSSKMKEDGHEGSRKDLLSFLASCLTALVNNPAPYTDRVMEALTERPVGADGREEDDEELMETSSVGTNESVKEAILLMDDEELDQLVAATATATNSDKAETPDTGTSATASVNFDLPVSPLVLVALDQLNNSKKIEPDAKAYVSHVIVDLCHSVVNPASLAQIVLRSGQSELLCGGASPYLRSFLPSQKNPHPKTTNLELSGCEPFTSLLLNLRESGGDACDLESPKSFQRVRNQIQLELTLMNKSRTLIGLGQVMLYMGEAVSSPSKTSSSVKLVHLYKLVAEGCIAHLVDEHKGNFETRKAENADSTLLSEKLQEIPSALELEESETSAAVKRILLDPILLEALSIPKPPPDSNMKASSLKRSSFVSGEFSKVCEILSLFRNTLAKSVCFPWFQNETNLIELHLDKAVNLLSRVYQESGVNSKKSRSKTLLKLDEHEGEKEITHCCCQILCLLFERPGLVSLTRFLSKLLKLLPLSVEVENKWGDRVTSNTSSCNKLGDLLVQMLDHWADLMGATLIPQGLELLLDNSKDNSSNHANSELNSLLCPSSCSRIVQMLKEGRDSDEEEDKNPGIDSSLRSSHKTFRLKVVPSFEEACGLLPEQLKPLFDQVCSVNSEALINCAVKLLNKLPQLVPVCGQSAPEAALSSAEKLQASVGTDIAKLLIKSEKEVFQRVNVWLQSWQKKPPKHFMWWLVRAFLEAQESFSVDCHKSIEALKDCTLHRVQEALTTAGEDEMIALRLICASLEEKTDTTYLETVVTHAAAAIRDRPAQVNTGHYQLLLVCAQACPSLTITDTALGNNQDLRIGALLLSLALRHLDRLAADKTRDITWEDYLLSLALTLIKPEMDTDFNFLLGLWSSFVKNTLRHLYKNNKLLELLAGLAPFVYSMTSKPTNQPTMAGSGKPTPFPDVQTLFNMCCSHTGFVAVMMSEDFIDAKAGLVKLLHTLGETEPSCYDRKLRKILVGAYSATLSLTDQRLLHMIERVSLDSEGKFECPLLWGKSVVDELSMTEALGSTLHRETPVANILSQLDIRRLHQSMLNFPVRQKLKGKEVVSPEELKSKEDCYDPKFLLRVLALSLTPDKRVPLHQFVDKGCLGYLLTALSSHDLSCRLLAYQALNDFHLHAQGSRWSERAEVSFLLDLLNASRSQDGQKLSSVVALFFARVSRLLLYPADGLYMPIFRFLVARPEIDLRNVPEFYKLFFSPGSNYKQERNWSLSLLAEGLRETSDYWLYQKKSVFRIILSFYGSALSDKASQVLVLSVVKSACMEKTVAVHLVKNQGLLTWLSAAVDGLTSRPEHCDALCEIVHALWISLSTHTHQEEDGRSVEASHENGDVEETEKEREAAEGDNSDSDDVGDDNDDDEEEEEEKDMDEETDDSNDSTSEAISSDKTRKSKKRKKSSDQEGKKKRKLSDNSAKIIKDKSPREDSESDSEDMSSGEDSTERIISDSSNKVTSTAKSDKLGKIKEVKRRTPPSMPKSTVAELGLLVRGLVWHLSKPSIRNVGKILEVHRGLIDLKRQSSNSQCQPSANNTSREENNTMNDKLVLLSAAETCIVLHRLGSAARIPELVSAAEAQLTRLGVNVRSVLCHGIRSSDGIERSAKLHEGDMKDTEEAVDVDNDSKQLSQTEQSGEEEGKTSSNLQSVAERRETVSGAANDITELENKELARSLLIGAREIFTLTQNVEFM